MASVEIRPLRTLEELHSCEKLQKEIWGFAEISVVPHHLLLTNIKNGGVLLGAFERQGSVKSLVGFVYGFPGIEKERLKHCSLMCAVVPEHRFQGLGYELKLKQREAVLAQGISLITWTFDPLVSSNAYFNLHKLGAISNCYERNLYGDMRDRLNASLETDRLTAEWWTESARVRACLDPKTAPSAHRGKEMLTLINTTEWQGDLLAPRDYELDAHESDLWLEIPYYWREMREQNMELVKEWRQVTRVVFERYFARGYWATDLVVTTHGEKKRAFYLLEQTPSPF